MLAEVCQHCPHSSGDTASLNWLLLQVDCHRQAPAHKIHPWYCTLPCFRASFPDALLAGGKKLVQNGDGDHAKLTDFGLACRIERYERSASEAMH
eukprot:4474269-Amphidinium_carterae.1